MKKTSLIFFLAGLLLFTNLTLVEGAQTKEKENNQTVIEENQGPVRDQPILVPTKEGPLNATFEEYNKIMELEKLPSSDLGKSFLLGDYKSGKILEYNNIDEVRPMASTSKLVSVYVILDKIKEGNLSLDDLVTVDHESSVLIGSTYKLKENDQKTVRELLDATMVVSGNDAITALSKKVAGSVENFAVLMNDKCKKLGLTNAHMVNPTGLTDYTIEDYNKMTTREMFILARSLIHDYPEILNYSSIKILEDPQRNYKEYNTNPLLGILPQIDGLKTGNTNAAGRVLIATGLSKGKEKESEDTRLIGIVTGSTNDFKRFVLAKRIMENGFKKYSWTILGAEENSKGKIQIENALKKEYDVYIEKPMSLLLDKEEKVQEKIQLDTMKAPLKEGTKVGTIIYSIDGKEIGNNNLVVKEEVREKGILNKIMQIYRDIFYNMEKSAA